MPLDKEKRKARLNAYWKEVRAWRREHHICTTCGKRDAAIGFVQCPECQQRRADYNDQWTKNNPDKIAAEGRKRKAERKQKGLCPKCGKPIDGKHALCENCHKKKRARDKRRYARTYVKRVHIDGFCVCCGEKAVPGKKLCKQHYDSACANLITARTKLKESDIRHPWKIDNDIAFLKKAR